MANNTKNSFKTGDIVRATDSAATRVAKEKRLPPKTFKGDLTVCEVCDNYINVASSSGDVGCFCREDLYVPNIH